MHAPSITIDASTEARVTAQQKPLPKNQDLHFVQDGCSIYYEQHVLPLGRTSQDGQDALQLVLIQGFAAGVDAWYPFLLELGELWEKRNGPGLLEVLCIENRGLGRSSAPLRKRQYSTTIMAKDVLSVMDHVGWDRPHVTGFSMGGMVAAKLAGMAPERVRSLVCMSVTGGGMQALPRSWRAFKFAIKGLLAKTASDRARVDVKFHFSKHVLRQKLPGLVPSHTVKDILLKEYLGNLRQAGPQPKAGFQGQMHAVMKHSVTEADVQQIRTAGFPVWFLHGRNDLVAMPKFAERLARKFRAPYIHFDGGHLIFRENAPEVASLMFSICTEVPNPQRSPITDLRLRLEGQQKAEDA